MAKITKKALIEENMELRKKANGYDEMHGKFLVEQSKSRKYLLDMAAMVVELEEMKLKEK